MTAAFSETSGVLVAGNSLCFDEATTAMRRPVRSVVIERMPNIISGVCTKDVGACVVVRLRLSVSSEPRLGAFAGSCWVGGGLGYLYDRLHSGRGGTK